MGSRMGVDPGDRPYMVRLESRPSTDAVDASGAPTETWSTLVANMPASKDVMTTRERFMADQLSASADTRFVINYRLDMDPDLIDVPKLRRIVHRDRVYDITGASLIGYREGIELKALAKVG
jgi:SPP1 family predicted phage head-tail adaptor